VPPTEKIMEAAVGDKDFWIVDVVGNFCFLHSARQGINSNLNLITDKGQHLQLHAAGCLRDRRP
jgi:type IV secretion system protein VirB9